MTDPWKPDSRFTLRSQTDSSPLFVAADFENKQSAIFSPTLVGNEDLDEDTANSPVSYSQDELDLKLAEMRQQVTEEVRENLFSELESKKMEYCAELKKEFEEFLSAARSKVTKEEPFLEPIRVLSLAFAQEISRAAFSSSDMKIEKAIDDCLVGLDLSSLDGLEIYVSRGWAERLEKEPLMGILASYPVFVDDSFVDGDVRLKLDSSQVENLISERIVRLQEQLANMDFGLPSSELQRIAMRESEEKESGSVGPIEDLGLSDSENLSETIRSENDGKSENDV